jgi:hypothetical protein
MRIYVPQEISVFWVVSEGVVNLHFLLLGLIQATVSMVQVSCVI